MSNTKICLKCGRELPISEFSKCEHNKDGLQIYCKECNKQYREEHKVVILEKKKQYYANNRETKLQYMKQYYTTLRGYCTRTRKDNIREDRKYGRIGNELPNDYPTVEDYMELLQSPDFYDGKQYDFNEMGLDRIDNSLPHILSNVVPCTTKHNAQRGRKSFEDFCALFR